MTTRRSFIRSATLASAGLIIAPSFFKYKSSYIGLQLYTVRDAMQQDPQGTLAKVAQIGYKSVEDAATVGIKYMVCAYLSAEERGDIDHYKQLAEQFNKSAETCKKAGIQFCYHNHDFEFEEQNGQMPAMACKRHG